MQAGPHARACYALDEPADGTSVLRGGGSGRDLPLDALSKPTSLPMSMRAGDEVGLHTTKMRTRIDSAEAWNGILINVRIGAVWRATHAIRDGEQAGPWQPVSNSAVRRPE